MICSSANGGINVQFVIKFAFTSLWALLGLIVDIPLFYFAMYFSLKDVQIRKSSWLLPFFFILISIPPFPLE